MYEGWHIEFTRHASKRMRERLIEEGLVRKVIAGPDRVERDHVHGGKLITKYLPDWDKILVVAAEERSNEGVLLVKTALWSKAN